jgi:hypothetical protein
VRSRPPGLFGIWAGRKTLDQLTNSGFAENFDAVRGLPLCDRAYTWTASVFLLLAEKLLAHDSETASIR